ncbi:MAG TPA: enoyl-CoA hydratase-related protein [Steroidobacteraceae bacterium]|nr:enoyl-CoA hydratase-related protein [Steroidobacteraceae bacterium]
MSEAILFELRGPVALITINRPESRNAINAEVRAGLFAAWKRFEEEPSARVAILTGAGDKAFCAGMDLKEASATGLKVPPRGFIPTLGDAIQVSKPTIAAVNGMAMAGGWLFAQMCDLCVAAEHATFAITEARVGRGTPWAAPLIHMLPQRIMMELLLTGEPMSAVRLGELGYINYVVPREQLLPRSFELAQRIAANAPLTIRACRALVYAATETGRTQALRTGDTLFEPVYLSADAQEGPRAFAEKRAPVWRGK